MERFGGGFKKGARGLATFDKGSGAPAQGKLKLPKSKDPLPLLRQSNRDTKPKAKFLLSVGGGVPIEKKNAKPSIFAVNSVMRPLAADNPPTKKNTGFSCMKFQSKLTEMGKTTAAVCAFTGSKSLLGKFSANAPTKKLSKGASERKATDKEPLYKPQAKAALPFASRAETKSSATRKRKAAESVTQDKKTVFPRKTGRANLSFTLKKAASEKGKDIDKQSGAGAENTKPVGTMRTKVSDGIVSKKRSLLAISTVAAPASKKSKIQDVGIVQCLADPNDMADGVTKAGSSSGGASHENEDSGVSAPLVPPAFKPAQTFPGFATDDELKIVAPSPDCREDCLSGVEEELEMKLLCALDDDKEDEFLTRAAAIQEFTDRAEQEQKELRNRLLDAHADVSESLLDALTDLMMEEGGIGIDKLDFDMNIDVDVGDVFLQEDIQVIQ